MAGDGVKRTNDQVAEEISKLTGLGAGKVQSMCPTLAGKGKLLHLLDLANSSDMGRKAKLADLRRRVNQLADVILKLVRHIHGLAGLPALREVAESATDEQLAKEIAKCTNLRARDVRSLCPRLADKRRLVRLLDITYSRMQRKERVAALRRQIDDLGEVILGLIRRFL